jgi:hypothetical protein
MLSRTSTLGSRLLLFHSRLAGSAQPFSSVSSASVATHEQQHQQELQVQQQQQQQHSSFIRPSLNPPLFQERINSDGSLTTGPQLKQQWKQQQQLQDQQPGTSLHTSSNSSSSQELVQKQATVRPPGVPIAAPPAAPITQQQLEQLVDMIVGAQRVVVLTGAGCSTESNIPDYRGPTGAYTTGVCVAVSWAQILCKACSGANAGM